MLRWNILCVVLSVPVCGFYIMRRFLWGATKFCNCLAEKSCNVVITGATSGIGLATAIELAKRNWHIIIGCRDINSGLKAGEKILAVTGNGNVTVLQLDLLDPNSIEDFVRRIQPIPIHVLINNAGVYPRKLRINPTWTNCSVTLTTNYIGPFYLTSLLLPSLKRTCETGVMPRVITVSSALSSKGCFTSPADLFSDLSSWDPSKAYANSKLACNLFSRELHNRYNSQNRILDSYCLFTGGMVNTNLNREFINTFPLFVQSTLKMLSYFLLKSPYEACQSVIHCAISDDVPHAHFNDMGVSTRHSCSSGLLFNNCGPINWPINSLDNALAESLWSYTETLLNGAT